MKRLEGRTRKWVALAGVLVVAAVAWFTMGTAGSVAGGQPESAHVGWFVLDAEKIRLGAVLIILSFGLRILLMDHLSGAGDKARQGQDEAEAEALDAAAEADVEK